MITRHDLARELVNNEAARPGFVEALGGGTVAEFAVSLKDGKGNTVPLGTWGEIGVEAG